MLLRRFIPAFLAISSLNGQAVYPLFECYETLSSPGRSAVASLALAGAQEIPLLQPVPPGARLVLSPGASNQEIVIARASASTSPPYVVPLQITSVTNPIARLIYTHTPGEVVTFETLQSTGYFSYFNVGTQTRTISDGSSNFLTPGSAPAPQPTAFDPGVRRFQFGAPLAERDDLIWTIDGQKAVGRITPEFACSNPGFAARAESILVAPGAFTEGLRLGAVSGGTPGAFTATVSAVYQQNSIFEVPSLSSGLQFSNVRVRNGVVLADVTASATANRRHYFFVLKVTDSSGRNALSSAIADVVNDCRMNVSPTSLPPAYSNSPYTTTFTATRILGPTTFAMEGPLPSGLSLSESGVLSGTPVQSGAFPLTLRSYRADGCFQRTPLTLTVLGQVCATNVTPAVQITLGGFRQNLISRRWQQTVTLRNTSLAPLPAPLAVALDNLNAGVSLATATGATSCAAPLGAPYTLADLPATSQFAPGATITLTLEFTNANPSAPITYSPRVLSGGANR